MILKLHIYHQLSIYEPSSSKHTNTFIDRHRDCLLGLQCYWKQFPIPDQRKLYLTGRIPVSTNAKLYISIADTSLPGSPFDLSIQPGIKIVKILGAQAAQ